LRPQHCHRRFIFGKSPFPNPPSPEGKALICHSGAKYNKGKMQKPIYVLVNIFSLFFGGRGYQLMSFGGKYENGSKKKGI
jgi:hypothetical protein